MTDLHRNLRQELEDLENKYKRLKQQLSALESQSLQSEQVRSVEDTSTYRFYSLLISAVQEEKDKYKDAKIVVLAFWLNEENHPTSFELNKSCLWGDLHGKVCVIFGKHIDETILIQVINQGLKLVPKRTQIEVGSRLKVFLVP